MGLDNLDEVATERQEVAPRNEN